MKCNFFALAALMLGLASCQQDFDAQVQVGNEVDFRLTIDAPDITRAGDEGENEKAGMNSAYGAIDYLQGAVTGDDRIDWGDVDLRYSLEVYDATGNYTDATPVKDRQVIIVDEYNPVTFELRLIPNRKYHFVVFADFVPQGATVEDVNEEKTMIEHQSELGLCHTIGENLRDITIKNDAINDERADAYFATSDIEITNSASQDIELKRPYGKVRVIATDLDQLNLNIEPAKISVKYYAKHPVAFNAVTGEIDTNVEEVALTFESEYRAGVCKEDLTNHFYTEGYDDYELFGSVNANGVERHTHMTLFTDYILAEEEQNSIHFDIEVFDGKNAPIKKTEFCTDIPVQRNHLTTIIGNVLTTATEIDVTINDNFDDETVIDVPEPVIDENTIVIYDIEDLMQWAWLVNNTDINYSAMFMANIELPALEIADDGTKYYYTETPITVTDGIPSGSNWITVGSLSNNNKYTEAIVEGYYHTIKGLMMNNSAGIISGFLGYCENIIVKDLTFDDAKLYSTQQYCSPIAYVDDGSYIYNVHTKNSTIVGTDYVSGVVSMLMDHFDNPFTTLPTLYDRMQKDQSLERYMPYTTMEKCTTSNTTVKGSGEFVGGICGKAYGVIIYDCHNEADVTGNKNVGGVAGYLRDYQNNEHGCIVNCSSTNSTIVGNTHYGAICGALYHDNGHTGAITAVVGCYTNSTIANNKIVGTFNLGNEKAWGNYAEGTTVDIAALNAEIDEYNAIINQYNIDFYSTYFEQCVYSDYRIPTSKKWTEADFQ